MLRRVATTVSVLALLLAAMAAVSAGFATAKPTVLCEEPLSPCLGSERYGSGTSAKATLAPGTTFKLKSSIGTIECAKSAAQGETTAISGEPLPGKLSEFTFSECKIGTNTNCTVTASGAPWTLSFTATGSFNGTMGINGLVFKPACTIFFTCTLKSKAMPTTVSINSGSPGHFIATEVAFERESGSCPNAVTWSAEYELTTPSPLYISTE